MCLRGDKKRKIATSFYNEKNNKNTTIPTVTRDNNVLLLLWCKFDAVLLNISRCVCVYKIAARWEIVAKLLRPMRCCV